MNFANIESTWEVIKDRPLGEYLNYLNDAVTDSKRKRDKSELEQNAMIYGAALVGAFYFAQHITGEDNAQD